MVGDPLGSRGRANTDFATETKSLIPFLIGGGKTATGNRRPGKFAYSSSAADQRRAVDAYFGVSAVRWKEIYEGSDLNAAIHQQRRAVVLALVDKLGLPSHSEILEIGCGAGWTAVALAERGYTVRAIDRVAGMLELTRRLAVEVGVVQRVVASAGDAHSLAFGDHRFDLVLAVGVTPYLDSLLQALQEMVRVLKPAGHLIINADNCWRLSYLVDPRLVPVLRPVRRKTREILERLGLRAPAPPKPFPRMYSIKEFDALLLAVGLQRLEGSTLGFGPFSFFSCKLLPDSLGVRLHQRLQALADRGVPLIRLTGAQYVVLARKPGPRLSTSPPQFTAGHADRREGQMPEQ